MRETGKIQKCVYVLETFSRFGVFPDEIEEVILPEVVRITGIGRDLTNKRYIEFNVWGNMFHPEWGQTNTWEWFADEVRGVARLLGGHSGYGGLSDVSDDHWSDCQGERIAFNPVIRFPSKPRQLGSTMQN